MKKFIFLLTVSMASCSTPDRPITPDSIARIPSSDSGNCNFLMKNILAFFNGDEKKAVKKLGSDPEKKTKVRLSAGQRPQKKAIHENLRLVQQMINAANKMVANNDRPSEVFVVFDERMAINMAYISTYEINLANIEKEVAEQQKGIIIHEYFHLILKRAIAKNSTTGYEKYLELELAKLKNLRIAKKYLTMTHEQRSLEFGLSAIAFVKFKLLRNKEDGIALGEAFREGLKNKREEFKAMGREDIIKKIEEVNAENIDALLDELELLSKKIELKSSKLKKNISRIPYDENVNYTIDKDLYKNSIRTTIISSGIGELFADLGAVLTLENPSALKEGLNSSLRDFAKLKTLEESEEEFRALYPDMYSSINSEHSLFNYLRGVLWNSYFVKIPKAERETKWPLMMSKLAESFADKINSSNSEIFISYKSVNIQLERIIHDALDEFVP